MSATFDRNADTPDRLRRNAQKFAKQSTAAVNVAIKRGIIPIH